MARPITWQSIAAPQVGGALAASALAAKQFNDSLVRLKTGFTDIGKNINDAATGAAAAFVMNSEDPMAAAAQIPQNDANINPLVVAGAVRDRSKDLLDTRSTEASIKSNELQGQLAQTNLDNILAANEGADLALPYRDLIFSGKKPNIDLNDPRWKSAAGREGLKFIDSWQKEFNDMKYQQGSLALQQNQAAVASEQLRQLQARKNAEDLYAAWRVSPEGAEASNAIQQRVAQQFANQTGAGAAFGLDLPGRFAGGAGIAAPEELNQRSPQKITYSQALNAVQAKKVQLENENIITDVWTRMQNEAAIADKENSYYGMTPGKIDQAILDNNPELTRGFLDWEPEDAQTRRIYQSTLARKEGPQIAKEMGITVPKDFVEWLTPQQEASLVELTKGEWSIFSDKEDSEAARAMRRKYIALNLGGGPKALEKRLADRQDALNAELSKLDRLSTVIQGRAISGKDLPEDALKYWSLTEEGQARQKALDELQNLGK